jgi:peptide/nickel transport system substrate-binding protein
VVTAAPVRTSAGLATLGISDATIDPDRRRPQGTLTVGLHYAHSPMWLDPQVYNSPVFNHFLYIVHDALIKPMAGNVRTYSLAEYAEMPNDYTSATFRLRAGLTFHDGTPLTTEDVKWSFEHYQGINSAILKDKTTRIEVLDDRTIIFHFKEPFLDFLDLYAVVGGAAWVVPRHYYEKVGGEAFKQRPIGAGPFTFVSMEVGTEMVFEAWEDYWRKVPHVKALKILGIRDPAAQWAAFQTGELDVAYLVPSRCGHRYSLIPVCNGTPTTPHSWECLRMTEPLGIVGSAPRLPDLLRRPLARPLQGNVRITRRPRFRCLDFD